jgi:thioredoxin reductase-like selenoprotein T
MAQASQALQARFPGLEVVSSQYPVTPLKQMAAQGVFLLQIGLVGVLMFGDHIFPAIGIAPPPLYLQWREKRGGAIIGVWFLVSHFL